MPREGARTTIALVALGILAAGYLILRPTLRVPYLALVEFPVAVVLVAFLLWQAMRRPAPPRALPQTFAPVPALRRHEQIVRTLPDPDAARLERTLAEWVETGEGAERVADVLGRAHAPDPARRAAERERILPLLSKADSRRARARLVRDLVPGD